MIQEYSAITDSVKLHSVQTNKFKTGILSFTVTMPMSRLDSPYSLILSKILEKNTKSYPSRLALSRRIDDLYVSSTDIRRIGFGKNMILSASAEMLGTGYKAEIRINKSQLNIPVENIVFNAFRIDTDGGEVANKHLIALSPTMYDDQFHVPSVFLPLKKFL